MEDQAQPGVKLRGRIDKRQLAALFSRADELIGEEGPRFRSGIGSHGRLGKALLEELFSRARVVQGHAPRRVVSGTQTEVVAKPPVEPTAPNDDVLSVLDEAIERVAADAEAQRRDPTPSQPKRDQVDDRLTKSVVGSVLERLDEVLGDGAPAPITGWSDVVRAEDASDVDLDREEAEAVPTLEQLNMFLTESTDDDAAALRTYLEDLEMPEPAAGPPKSELQAMLSKSDEIHFEGYEEDLERLLIETYQRYRSVPDALRVDPKNSNLDLLDTETLEERRAQRKAEELRPRTHQTERLARPPGRDPGLAPAANVTPQAPPLAPPVDPFALDPFTGQPSAPGAAGAPGAEVDPFKLDPFTGKPLAEGEAPKVLGPPPSGAHNLPGPLIPPGGVYSPDGPPLHTNPNPVSDLPFSAGPAPAPPAHTPRPSDPFQLGQPLPPSPFGPGPGLGAPLPTSPTQPSPSQTGGFNPMEDPGSAARLPTGPPPERTPARGSPLPPGLPRRVASPLTPGVPPIYPVESGEFHSPPPARPAADPRQQFEQQLLLNGLRGMLERANPPRGQPKSTPVTVLHDRTRNVFRAPLHPRLEAGDRFQLANGQIYRVLSSELVFIDGSPCFQEAACSRLGHMNAPLRDSWDQT